MLKNPKILRVLKDSFESQLKTTEAKKMIQGYCVKCKKKGQHIKDASITQTSRGGYMAKGKCPDCGTSICAMMSKDNAEKALKSNEAKKAF